MAAKPDQSKSSGADRLPFEPKSNRKKPAKPPAPAPNSAAQSDPAAASDKARSRPSRQPGNRESAAIPAVVNRRMVRRIAIFSGFPTALGMLTFVASYVVVSQQLLKIPTVAVLLVSAGFFGLGVLGLSYGALSASWDEERVGGLFGWREFTTNFSRTVSAWRDASRQSKSDSSQS